MSRKSYISGYAPILIIILVAIIAVGAYLLGTQSKDSPLQVSAPKSSSPSPTPDLTTDWETYTGQDYSFKHPTGLKSDTGAAGRGVESIRFQFIAQARTESELSNGYAFVVTKAGLVSKKSPEQWARERRDGSKEICEKGVFSEIKTVSVDQGNGFQYSATNCLADNYTSSYIGYDNKVYEITQHYNSGYPETREKYQRTTELILSTFKFIK